MSWILDGKRGQGVEVAVARQDASEAVNEILIDGPSGNKLAGTFLLPEGASPAHRVPAVVFITGSGLQDRDETIFGHKPFRAIATTLAQAGIASIRCDDRGFGKSTGDGKLATTLISSKMQRLRSHGCALDQKLIPNKLGSLDIVKVA